ncbi:hypothetical protein ACP70R_017915 [Stipagrostis hirtigluma subsp. patula]
MAPRRPGSPLSPDAAPFTPASHLPSSPVATPRRRLDSAPLPGSSESGPSIPSAGWRSSSSSSSASATHDPVYQALLDELEGMEVSSSLPVASEVGAPFRSNDKGKAVVVEPGAERPPPPPPPPPAGQSSSFMADARRRQSLGSILGAPSTTAAPRCAEPPTSRLVAPSPADVGRSSFPAAASQPGP